MNYDLLKYRYKKRLHESTYIGYMRANLQRDKKNKIKFLQIQKRACKV